MTFTVSYISVVGNAAGDDNDDGGAIEQNIGIDLGSSSTNCVAVGNTVQSPDTTVNGYPIRNLGTSNEVAHNAGEEIVI